MITCEFWGRLGNNLFQTATTISTAKQLGTDFILPTNTSVGHVGTPPVDLDIFNYDYKRGTIPCQFEYREPRFEYDQIQVADNTRLYGFFQSYKYFDHIREELINTYFSPSQQIQEGLSKYNVSSNSLGISVRRGDYLLFQDNHCVLSTDYYQDALNKYFQNNIDQVYIFSDDLDWCRTVFGPDAIYVEDSIGVQLFLMTRMKNLILSNSTFAWWGAYLNQNNGLIITPTPWFGPNNFDKDTQGLYCNGWTPLPHNICRHLYTLTDNMFR